MKENRWVWINSVWVSLSFRSHRAYFPQFNFLQSPPKHWSSSQSLVRNKFSENIRNKIVWSLSKFTSVHGVRLNDDARAFGIKWQRRRHFQPFHALKLLRSRKINGFPPTVTINWVCVCGARAAKEENPLAKLPIVKAFIVGIFRVQVQVECKCLENEMWRKKYRNAATMWPLPLPRNHAKTGEKNSQINRPNVVTVLAYATRTSHARITHFVCAIGLDTFHIN